MSIGQPGREDLLRWRGASPSNYYDASPNLARVFALRAGPALLAATGPNLGHFGQVVAEEVEPAVAMVERHREFPAHVKYDALGQHRESIEFHPAHLDAGRAIWASGMLALPNDRAGDFEMAGLFYLLSHVGEGGHACPVVCTAGLARALGRRGPDALAERHLDALRGRDYPRSARGSQFLTEIQGGSDVGANVTRAVPDVTVDGAWRITGEKWFCSVADAQLFAVMARPEGGVAGTRGLGLFLVPRSLDGSAPNGFAIRRLKDKLGTRSVASGEVEFVDAEAFLLSGEPTGDSGPSDGKGLGRMMELTNAARLGIALFGLGNARRALVESLCYTRQRRAFGGALLDKPLMRRKLAEMIVDVEAAQTMVFDSIGAANHRQPRGMRQRIAVPVTKLKVCRLGITAASDAIEIHGGNGYIETWPVARLLRDAQVNTIWEGPNNILCLDVRRGIEQTRAHETLLARMHDAVSVSDGDETTDLVARRIEDLDAAITAWAKLDSAVAEARLFPLAQFMGDVYAGALLIEQSAWERAAFGTDRKALVARLYAQRYLADRGPLRGIDVDSDEALDRFDELVDGALRL